nr:hypothetical protein [Vibrio eleionomae]
MEEITQLKKDFYARIGAFQATASKTVTQNHPTLSLLTDEELKELGQVWVELTMWKNKSSH